MGRDGTATRERLLDAAEHLFARQGVDAVTIREINDRAGQRNASAAPLPLRVTGAAARRGGRAPPARDRRRAGPPARRRRRRSHHVVHAVLTPLIERRRIPTGATTCALCRSCSDRGIAPATCPSRPRSLTGGRASNGTSPACYGRRAASGCWRCSWRRRHCSPTGRHGLETGARPPLGHAAFTRELVAMATGMVARAAERAARGGREAWHRPLPTFRAPGCDRARPRA